ncbi:BAG domain-containing protein [Daldinia bambusicola]|nr:BAG domain-containing protein [Daldinia bambusicola]
MMVSRFWGSSRNNISPYASQTDTQDVPHVTEDDFSYITSEDLENTLPSPSRAYDPQSRRAPPPSNLDDDVLLIKNKGITYPVHFPAYSIGDGKLLVRDVRVRVGLVMDLSDRRTRRMKMLYKGRHLTEQDIPIRDYGVKNNSELLVVVPEGRSSDDDDESSSEEVVVTEDPQKSKKAKKNKGRKKKKDRIDPRESTANLEVPGRRADREGRKPSPDPSIHPSRVPSPAVPAGPTDKLAAIRNHFDMQLLPLCQTFMDNPPRDMKKLEDEHRKLSETIMQHVLLKLDEVDTGGDPDVRAKRRELVKYVQDVLKDIDERLPLSIRPKDR